MLPKSITSPKPFSRKKLRSTRWKEGVSICGILLCVFLINNSRTPTEPALQSAPSQPGTVLPRTSQPSPARSDYPQLNASALSVDVWARRASTFSSRGLTALVGNSTIDSLRKLCGRCLYRTLTHYSKVRGMGRFTIVLTGDIPAMWTRDSAVQVAAYLPRITSHPALRGVVEGAIRAQAFFILQDPWANAYNPDYKKPETLSKTERELGRGGWVWTRNFEVDSIAYFFNLLWDWYQTPGIWAPEQLLAEALIHDAVVLALDVLVIEQDHDEKSPYRYSELPRNGLGPAHKRTGMVWSAFRPSDDPQKYSYSIASNIHVAGALLRLTTINRLVWCDGALHERASQLYSDITTGIRTYGVFPIPDAPGQRVYAYEVDGLGNALLDFDDPNVPSLLSIPLLGWEGADMAVYAETRKRIFSSKNPYYFKGSKFEGLGSPHTYTSYIWPLATSVEALTTQDAGRQAQLLRYLSQMDTVNGLMHESVHVDAPERYSRAEFGWANTMLVVAVEQLLGVDCDAAAEEYRLETITAREAKEPRVMPNKGPESPLYYETLQATISHV